MHIKLLSLGTIEYEIQEGAQGTVHSLSIRGAQAAVDFLGDGFRDGLLGVNAGIPLNAKATKTIDGTDVTLTAQQVLSYLRKLARPVAKIEAERQVTVEQIEMPTKEA